jgi:DNA-binding winged helix-turn-helix (wHTH) protein/tetratricopeptide (TPR) repeat protein
MDSPARTDPSYRFGLFEVFPETGRLFRQGQRVKLQEQPFKLLLLLVEKPGEIVPREAIRQHLWPDNTFVEFDKSLGTAVLKLRQALGDDADNPRFVETVPKRGYRFLAPVTRAGAIAHETPSPAVIAAPALDTRPPAEIAPPAAMPAVRHVSFHRLFLIAVIAIAIVGAAIGVYRAYGEKSALKSTDLVILSGFKNSTGEPAFDDTLFQAFRITLDESPFLNMMPDKTVRATLEGIGRQPGRQISLEDARAACAAARAAAVLHGEILQESGEYRLRLRAIRCQNERMLASEEVRVTSREEVLTALGAATDTLRHRLGEPQSSIEKFGTPLTQATTRSLAALKAFSLGEAKRTQGFDYEAVPNYSMAVDLDPNFALGYARLGTIYQNAQEYKLGSLNYTKAFELREHTTERERLYLTARYYSTVAGDLEKSEEAYLLWRQIYPHDMIPANNLADTYLTTGQCEKALASAREARDLNPSHAFPVALVEYASMCLGRLDEAKAAYQDAINRKLDGVNLRACRYLIAFGESDEEAMNHELEWARGNPRESELLNAAAWAAIARGKVKQGRVLFHSAEENAVKNDLKEFAGDVALDDALSFFGLASFQPESLIERYVPVMSIRSIVSLAVLGNVGAFWGSSLSWGIFCDRISWETDVIAVSGSLDVPAISGFRRMDASFLSGYIKSQYCVKDPSNSIASDFTRRFLANYPV